MTKTASRRSWPLRGGVLALVVALVGVVVLMRSGTAVPAIPTSGPCGQLYDELSVPGGDAGAVAATFGFPTEVPVPASLEIGKILCWGTRPADQSGGFVLNAIAVENVSEDLGLLVESANRLEGVSNWSETATASGFPPMMSTSYGLATDADPGSAPANLWEKIQTYVRETQVSK